MNGLNCESKNKLKKFLLYCAISLISIFLTLVIIFLILFQIPGFGDLITLNFIVYNDYYGEINSSKISNGILSGYIDSLEDKYSAFYNAENTSDRYDRLNGIHTGYGIYITKNEDSEDAFITYVFPDSPAMSSGLAKGDIITHINGQSLADVGYSSFVELLSGEVGDTVSLTVYRNGSSFDVEMVYSEITLTSVFYEKVENVAYIKILSFNELTPEQFINAVNSAMNDNCQALIFDLRNNGGGTIDSVTEMMDFLFPEGDLIYAKYKNGKVETLAKSSSEEIDMPMAVLINENTASAAEIFASNMREFGKGILVGEKTYGKGVMQNTYGLSKGTSVTVTVAEIYTHNMTSYNGVGVIPDIEIKLSKEEKDKLLTTPIKNDKAFKAASDKLNGVLYEG